MVIASLIRVFSVQVGCEDSVQHILIIPQEKGLVRVSVSHSGDYEEYYLLGYNALPPASTLVSCSAYSTLKVEAMFLRNVG
jgi:hypothetical protein